MTILMALRIVHVVFGIYIVGSYLFMVLILESRLKRLGPAIQGPVMRALMPILTPVNGISFGIIIGTGLALTFIMRSGALNTLFTTTWGVAMIIGLAVTIAVLVIGFGFLMPTGKRMGKLGSGIEGRAPNPDEGKQLHQLSARVDTLSRVNLVLILIALATMIASRYI